jgi:hypothetical protein
LVIQKLDLTSIGLFTTTPANDDDVDNAINDNVFADDDNMDDDSSLSVTCFRTSFGQKMIDTSEFAFTTLY